MAIIIERTITVKNDKSSLNNPLYLYVGDGDITCIFSIYELKKSAQFGMIDRTNLITENASYGEVRIYKPNNELVFTNRAEIIDDKLQAVISFDNLDETIEAGVHQLQIHLYDESYGAHNRFTIPPVELNVLLPVGMVYYDGGSGDSGNTGGSGGSGNTGGTENMHTHSNKTTLDSITDARLAYWDNKSNFSGSYNDLINKPTNLATQEWVNNQIANSGGSGGGSSFSGSYNDLTDKPTIPTRTSQLTNDSNFTTQAWVTNEITRVSTGGSVDLSAYATMTYVNSELANKANTSHTHSNYVTTTALNNKHYVTESEVDQKIADVTTGGTVDLSGYATTTYVDTELANKADTGHTHSGYAAYSHTHSNYSLTSHSHSNYATTTALSSGLAGKSDTSHTHSNYATTSYVDSKSLNYVLLTKAEYDALTTKDSNTFYCIKEV